MAVLVRSVPVPGGSTSEEVAANLEKNFSDLAVPGRLVQVLLSTSAAYFLAFFDDGVENG